ncbi:MAG: DoxX family membrane protein, partial [Gemmatimonadetes bacterium]|nr:DoxX family membrane protein [Gemmatimonadota bacterium]
MKQAALLFLRLTIAYLLVIWGADKLANPEHGLAVSRMFYGGLFGGRALMPAYGVAQIALGGLLALGVGRRFLYPAAAAITGTTLLGVWRSVADPWGWYLEGSN